MTSSGLTVDHDIIATHKHDATIFILNRCRVCRINGLLGVMMMVMVLIPMLCKQGRSCNCLRSDLWVGITADFIRGYHLLLLFLLEDGFRRWLASISSCICILFIIITTIKRVQLFRLNHNQSTQLILIISIQLIISHHQCRSLLSIHRRCIIWDWSCWIECDPSCRCGFAYCWLVSRLAFALNKYLLMVGLSEVLVVE